MRAAQRVAWDFNAEDSPNIESCCVAAREWSSTIPARKRQQAAWAFVRAATDEYVDLLSTQLRRPFRIEPPPVAMTFTLDGSILRIARALGRFAFEFPVEQACFRINATYPAMLPTDVRRRLGMFYTPPALSKRLIDTVEAEGVDWQNARVLDPACGGGAFLLPVALRMREAALSRSNVRNVEGIFDRLCGFEIDPFAAWLTETWLRIAFADVLDETSVPSVVKTCNTLDQQAGDLFFDLVIGNPPYGRVALSASQRTRFKRSLYGHANLYGVFTDAALRLVDQGGLVAFVSPPSFLAGEYFKSLRCLLAKEAPPISIDFIDARKGIFEDVLQEALLAVYRKDSPPREARTHHLRVSSDSISAITSVGNFALPKEAHEPWIVPRAVKDRALVKRMKSMDTRLKDWGYQVSTGPLVWNRFKEQLRERPGKNVFPLVWAEAVAGPGRFIHRAEKRNHLPYFFVKPNDAWLKVGVECVLVQRTTAKEQRRRLIAAELPRYFIDRHGAVIVENHLNMIKPIAGRTPKVSPAAVAAFLNSTIADRVFRCMNGSVAVSAFELEAMPLPASSEMKPVEQLLSRKPPSDILDAQVSASYLGDSYAS
jgi:adenine-specific DNA-methyltransferase